MIRQAKDVPTVHNARVHTNGGWDKHPQYVIVSSKPDAAVGWLVNIHRISVVDSSFFTEYLFESTASSAPARNYSLARWPPAMRLDCNPRVFLFVPPTAARQPAGVQSQRVPGQRHVRRQLPECVQRAAQAGRHAGPCQALPGPVLHIDSAVSALWIVEE